MTVKHRVPDGLIARAAQKAQREIWRVAGWDYYTGQRILRAPVTGRIGSRYGGWRVPEGILTSTSICYCAGAGEDVTFDLELVRRYGCVVFSFDPTPRAIAHIEQLGALPDRLRFLPVGIWDLDEAVRFYAPANPAHVSHSALNLQRTDEYFEAPCRSLSSLMDEFGHRRIDLLKLDIEGAEYRVLTALVDSAIRPRALLVEYDEIHQPSDDHFLGRILASIEALKAAGYRLIAKDGKANYTFLHREPIQDEP